MRFSNINNEEGLDKIKEVFIFNRANLIDVFGDCIYTAIKDFTDNTEKYKEKCLEQEHSINYPLVQFDYGVPKSMLESFLSRAYDVKLEDVVYSDEEGNHHYDFSFGLSGQRIYGYGDNYDGSLTLYCTFVE